MDEEEKRLLSEFLGIDPYKPNTFTSQILVSAEDPETNIIKQYSINRLKTTRDTVSGRLIDNPESGVVRLSKDKIIASASGIWKILKQNPIT